MVEQQLGVEVAPAELAAEGVGGRAARQRILELARRQAAEAQIGREARGVVAAERVVVVDVLAHRPVEEGAHPPPPRRLAATCRIVDLLLEAEVGQRRDAALRDAARQRRQLARRRQDGTAVGLEPGAVVVAEDRLRLAGRGADLAGSVRDVEARVSVQGGAGVGERRRDGAAAVAREGRHVGAEVQRGRSGLARERGQLALGRAVADDEAGVALAQRGVEIGEAVEQELRSRSGGVAAVDQPAVEDEDRHQPVGALARGVQGWMVVEAEVAPEPEDRGGHCTECTAPPRRGSPPPEISPPASRTTAWTPPK
jgi:hypothetical protein